MSDYWADRQTHLSDVLINQSSSELKRQYLRLYKQTLAKLKALYNEVLVSKADGTLLVSDLHKYNRYYELINELEQDIVKFGNMQVDQLDEHLVRMYKDNWNLLNDAKFLLNSDVNEESMRKVIDTVWCNDGIHFSDRIWNNQRQLLNRVEEGLVDCVATGRSVSDLAKEINLAFGVGYSNAERLSRTEIARVQTESTLDKYNEAGIGYYTIYTEKDACDECKKLAGQKIPISKIVLPVHPNCRCCTLAVL